MKALINITEKVSSNLSNDLDNNSNVELRKLLKQKIEDSITKDKSIIISISNPMMHCRNCILIDDYEIDEKELYINNENFELRIDLDKTEIKYDDTYDAYFTLFYNDTEICIYLLD